MIKEGKARLSLIKMDKIKYSDLSWPLKYAVVTAWLVSILFIVSFVAGFLAGV
jgi:hypothetical protein